MKPYSTEQQRIQEEKDRNIERLLKLCIKRYSKTNAIPADVFHRLRELQTT